MGFLMPTKVKIRFILNFIYHTLSSNNMDKI